MKTPESTRRQGLALAENLPPDLLHDMLGALELGAAVWQLEDPQDPASLRMLAYNAAAERSSGVPWASFLNKTMAEAFPFILKTPIPKLFAEVALCGGSLDLQDQAFTSTRHGEQIYAVRAHGLKNRCVLVTFTNITVERQLNQDLDRFFTLTLDLVCIAGTDGYFKRVNPAFERALGYTQAELLSTPFLSFVHPEDVSATVAEVRKLSNGAATTSFENRYRKKSGQFCWLSWTCAPFGTKLYATGHDITAQKTVESNLRQTTRELAQRAHEAQLLAQSRQSLIERYLGVRGPQQPLPAAVGRNGK